MVPYLCYIISKRNVTDVSTILGGHPFFGSSFGREATTANTSAVCRLCQYCRLLFQASGGLVPSVLYSYDRLVFKFSCLVYKQITRAYLTVNE